MKILIYFFSYREVEVDSYGDSCSGMEDWGRGAQESMWGRWGLTRLQDSNSKSSDESLRGVREKGNKNNNRMGAVTGGIACIKTCKAMFISLLHNLHVSRGERGPLMVQLKIICSMEHVDVTRYREF